MHHTVARRAALAAAFALVLATGACTSSTSTGSTSANTASTGSTSANTASAGSTSANTASTRSASPATSTPATHAVAASDFEVGTDDYHGTAHAMPGIVQFTTPSGNIACTFSPGTDPVLHCSITAHDFPLPARPASCTLDWAGGLMTLDDRGAALGLCVGGETVTAHSRTLAYGDVLTTRGITCTSRPAALTCTDHGHGFQLSRTAAVFH